ncbi:ABC transporter ATP-binding protein [Desulfosoma caldarium]|uniref:Iron complex transport system ATP-binding protein n=1 Tax=Desulfosoma caldarium TaxID=610254 RepID=A0A3N1UU35_9BACT|nr:ABC transporter ATP-binding protein [Desulfosoma caldarium]ROQ92250.1 iron complex transport system ATP-binding protein [Desulfosoma caldarium]
MKISKIRTSAEETSDALWVQDVAFAYDGLKVLQGVSFRVSPGRFTVVLGRNGSGKSTLFRVIVGLLKPQRGSIRVFGRDLHGLGFRDRTRLLGFLPQQHHAIFPFRVRDVVLTGRAAHVGLIPKSEDREAAMEALAQLGIDHPAEKPYTDLSGGEQQLVLIARVLAQNPRLLLLDEPTAHLDFVNANRLLELIRHSLCPKMTVVAIVHDPNLAFWHGDDFLFLAEGRVLIPDPQRPPWSSELVQRVYGMVVDILPWKNRAVVMPKVGS